MVLWHTYRAAEETAINEVVRKWNDAHPDVPVDCIAVPSGGFTSKLEAAIPHGNGPDLFIASHDALGDWRRMDLLATQEVDRTAYFAETVTPLVADGKLYGLPLAWKTLALFYRRDLLPVPPTDTAALFALRREGVYPLAYEAGSMYSHAAFVHAFGGVLIDDSGQARLDSQQQIAALTWVRSLADRHLIPDESSSLVATRLFNDGHALTVMNGPWFIGEIGKNVAWAVAPLPSHEGKPLRPLLTVEAVFLSAKALRPVGARSFAAYLAGAESGIVRAEVGRQPVAARAAWDKPEIAGDPVLAAFRAQLPTTQPMSTARAMQAIWEPSQRALRRVLRGEATPGPALADAQADVARSLLPPPPPPSTTPYLVVLGLGMLGLSLVAVRRLQTAGGFAEVRRAGTAYAYLAPALVALAVLVLAPLVVGVGMSAFHYDGVHFAFVGLDNFYNILRSSQGPVFAPLSFYFTLLITILWTVTNVTLHVAIGIMLALLLRSPALKLRGVYRVLLIIPWAMPSYITAKIWKGMFHRQFGAINALLALCGIEPVSWFSQFWTAFCANLATNVWLGFPFMMVVTLGALSRISPELEEAAALDGANRWQRFWKVTLPIVWPTLLPSVILGAVWTFNMFNVVFLVSGGEPDDATDILVSQAYRWAFDRTHQYGYAAAYAVLIFLVLAGQSALARRFSAREASL